MAEKLVFDPRTGELISTSKHVSVSRKHAGSLDAIQITGPKQKRRSKIEIEIFIKKLQSENVLDKELALKALMRGGNADIVKQHVFPLITDSNESLRLSTVQLLTKHSWQAHWRKDVERFLASKDTGRKLRVLSALGEMGSFASPVVDLIIKCLLDADSKLVETASKAIAAIGYQANCIDFTERLIRHKKPEFRLRIISVLKECGVTAKQALFLVLSRLDDPLPEIRDEAKLAIDTIGFDASALKVITRILDHSNLNRVFELLEFLKSQGPVANKAASLLIPLLKHPDESLVSLVLSTLNEIGINEDCVKPMERLRFHPSWEMRSRILMTAKSLNVEKSTQAFMAASSMSDSEYEVRRVACSILEETGYQHLAVNGLKSALKNKNREVREMSLELIQPWGRSAIALVSDVVACLEDKESSVRRLAARTFVMLGYHDSCLSRLTHTLSYANQDSRLLTIESLGEIDNLSPEIISLVIPLCAEKDVAVREASFFMLSSLERAQGCEKALFALCKSSKNDSIVLGLRLIEKWTLLSPAILQFLKEKSQIEHVEIKALSKRILAISS